MPPMSDAGTVFLVDDDPAVLASLGQLLRSAGYRATAFASAREFMDGGHDQSDGCLVLDVNLPGLNGIDLQRTLAERGSALPIVFLTGAPDIHIGIQAMKGGAADFLTKPVDDKVLLDAVDAAVERSRIEAKARSRIRDIRQRLDTLTPREREVLPLVVAGWMNKQAAAELGTSEKTIKIHRARVMAKMGTRTLPDLVRMAERAGVLLP
jgi:FixJ family two-component response regulator